MFSKEKFKLYKQGLILVFLTWGLYFLYMWPRMLFWGDGGLIAGWTHVWNDWSTHFAFVSKFAYQPPNIWFLSHPFCYTHKPTHHFVANLISGILVRCGLDVVLAFIIPSILTTLLLLIALYFFYSVTLRAPLKAYLAMTLFFANGGLGFVLFVKDLIKKPLVEMLTFPSQEYTNYFRLWGVQINCSNIITSEIFPQRAFLLGLPITLFIITVFLIWVQKDFTGVSTTSLVALGLLAGSVFAVHPFSYIVILVFFVIFYIFKPTHLKEWFLIAFGVSISTLFIYSDLFGTQISSNKFFVWSPGSFTETKSIPEFIFYWLLNWGIFLPISLIAIFRMKYYKHPLIIGGVVIFILSNLFLISPWFWNNYKLITWSYLIFCIPTSAYLVSLWDKKRFIIRVVVVVLILFMTISGFLDLYRITKTERLSYVMWNADEVKLAEDFRLLSKPTARVLTADTHNHWVLCLTGRQMLIGHGGKLRSWGIDCGNIHEDLAIMFAGGSHAEQLLKDYAIDFVVIGPPERTYYQPNEDFFSNRYQKVLQRGGYSVYKISL